MESEIIEVRESHPRTFEIISSNSENNEINYNTGIKHIMRLPYITQKTYGISKEIEVNRTDTKISQLRSRLTDKFTFEFFPIPIAIVIKASRILSLDNAFIDGVGYIAEDDFETERLKCSNLYDFIATMTPNNRQFDSSSNKNVISNTQYTGGFVQLSDGKGFIKLRP